MDEEGRLYVRIGRNYVAVAGTFADQLAASQAEVARLEAEVEEARREISAWRDATKANERTKVLHIGEYHITMTVVDEDGEEATWNTPVPWTVVKEIMEAIRLDKSRLQIRAPSTDKKEADHA